MRICLAVSCNHPFARRQSVSLAEAVREPFVGPMHEEYPQHRAYLAAIFAKLNDKPRLVEEHDGWAGVFSAVDAGTGVAIASDAFSYAFGESPPQMVVEILRGVKSRKPAAGNNDPDLLRSVAAHDL